MQTLFTTTFTATQPIHPRTFSLPTQTQQLHARRLCIITNSQANDNTPPPSSTDNNNNNNEEDDATAGIRRAPWSMTFDLKERETLWTDENKARLVRIVASYEMNMELAEVEERLEALNVLLPGIRDRVSSLKPSLLAALLQQGSGLVTRLINLKNLLPNCNISTLTVTEPQLLLQDLTELESNIERLQNLLNIDSVDVLVEQNPRFLQADIVEEVLEELRRLMPGRDGRAILLNDPSWLLRVERGTKRMGDHPDTP